MRIRYCVWLVALLAPSTVAQGGETQPGTGVLKVCSAPFHCAVFFRDKRYVKDRAVMTFERVPVGTHQVRFEHEGKVLARTAEIRSGETTILFGALKDAEAPGVYNPRGEIMEPPPVPTVVRHAPDSAMADELYRYAELLRNSFNPFLRKKRYRHAERIYRMIVRHWPDTRIAGLSHYRLGQIYESSYYQRYAPAAEEYQAALAHPLPENPQIYLQIAEVYERGVRDYARARQWYEKAAEKAVDETTRRNAAGRAASLQQRGF